MQNVTIHYVTHHKPVFQKVLVYIITHVQIPESHLLKILMIWQLFAFFMGAGTLIAYINTEAITEVLLLPTFIAWVISYVCVCLVLTKREVSSYVWQWNCILWMVAAIPSNIFSYIFMHSHLTGVS